MTLSSEYFNNLYAAADDPWGFGDRWYEKRKRALTLALLPDLEYAAVLELGCSIGVLTEELAPRCRSLLATDVSSAAVDAARSRCAHLPQVTVVQGAVVPSGAFDLVVVSEVLYYFELEAARRFADEVMQTPTVVAVHWRHPVADYPISGDEAHGVLLDAACRAGHVGVVRYEDDDVIAAVWAKDGRSLADREGLT